MVDHSNELVVLFKLFFVAVLASSFINVRIWVRSRASSMRVNIEAILVASSSRARSLSLGEFSSPSKKKAGGTFSMCDNSNRRLAEILLRPSSYF